jgi:hypothetical protein
MGGEIFPIPQPPFSLLASGGFAPTPRYDPPILWLQEALPQKVGLRGGFLKCRFWFRELF